MAAITFRDSAKVSGYLIAGLELQRVILYRHNVVIPLKELHHIVRVYFSHNRDHYKRLEKDIKRQLDKEDIVQHRACMSYLSGDIAQDDQVERLISRKVKDYKEKLDDFDDYLY